MRKINSKIKYLSKIHKLLLWKYSENEISNIIQDYKEYFDIGIASGKNEADICTELGTPYEVVKSLDSEFIFTKSFKNKNNILFLLIISYLVVNFSLINNYTINIIKNTLINLPIFILFSWLFVGGKKFCINWFLKYKSEISFQKVFLLHLLDLLMAILLFIVSYFINSLPCDMFFNIEVSKLGILLSNFYYIFIFFNLILVLFWIMLFKNNSIIYFSLICHNFGIIGTLICQLNILHILSNIEDFKMLILRCELPYLEGLIISIVFLVYYYLVIKEKKWTHN